MGELTDGLRVAVAGFSLLYSPYTVPQRLGNHGGIAPLQEGAATVLSVKMFGVFR